MTLFSEYESCIVNSFSSLVLCGNGHLKRGLNVHDKENKLCEVCQQSQPNTQEITTTARRISKPHDTAKNYS